MKERKTLTIEDKTRPPDKLKSKEITKSNIHFYRVICW